MKQTKIQINIELNENHLAEKITWDAPDGDVENHPAKAFFLSLWDGAAMSSMRVEMWQKDLFVDEMKQFIHQTMLSLSETYEKATGDAKLSNDMRDFCLYFAEKAGILEGGN